jgi:hypothetical protein
LAGNIPLRIDNRGLAVRPDQVRSMRKTVQVELVEMYLYELRNTHLSSPTRPSNSSLRERLTLSSVPSCRRTA